MILATMKKTLHQFRLRARCTIASLSHLACLHIGGLGPRCCFGFPHPPRASCLHVDAQWPQTRRAAHCSDQGQGLAMWRWALPAEARSPFPRDAPLSRIRDAESSISFWMMLQGAILGETLFHWWLQKCRRKMFRRCWGRRTPISQEGSFPELTNPSRAETAMTSQQDSSSIGLFFPFKWCRLVLSLNPRNLLVPC